MRECQGHRLPATVHQIWLGGSATDERWDWVLSLASVLLILRPRRHLLHYDAELPRCARVLATPVHVVPPTAIYGRKLVRAVVRSDVLRLQLLLEHGGLYMDNDVFAVRPLDELRRRCLRSPLYAGIESRCTQVVRRPPGGVLCDDDPRAESYRPPTPRKVLTPDRAPNATYAGWPAASRADVARAQAAVDAAGGHAVLNNGVLLAAPNSTFVHVWLQTYRELEVDPRLPKDGMFWSGSLPWRLALALPGLLSLRPALAPLPWRTAEQCQAHMRVASLWHVTGMSARTFRRNTLVQWGAMRAILAEVEAALAAAKAAAAGGSAKVTTQMPSEGGGDRNDEDGGDAPPVPFLDAQQIACVEQAVMRMRLKYCGGGGAGMRCPQPGHQEGAY